MKDFNFKDEQFLSAIEKGKILADWTRFLKNGLRRQDFTIRLYEHLHLHCDFIAHYNIHGFYGEYFECGDDRIRFLAHFDLKKIAVNYWSSLILSGAYSDLNNAMVETAEKFLPVLYAQARNEQKEKDLALANALLARYGLTLTESVKPRTTTAARGATAATQGNLF